MHISKINCCNCLFQNKASFVQNMNNDLCIYTYNYVLESLYKFWQPLMPTFKCFLNECFTTPPPRPLFIFPRAAGYPVDSQGDIAPPRTIRCRFVQDHHHWDQDPWFQVRWIRMKHRSSTPDAADWCWNRKRARRGLLATSAGHECAGRTWLHCRTWVQQGWGCLCWSSHPAESPRRPWWDQAGLDRCPWALSDQRWFSPRPWATSSTKRLEAR